MLHFRTLGVVMSLNSSANVATLALGSRPRQKACKGAGQESRQRSRKGAEQEEARESNHILPGV